VMKLGSEEADVVFFVTKNINNKITTRNITNLVG
jgi:hypothetical protein